MYPKLTMRMGTSDPSTPLASTVWEDLSAYLLSVPEFKRAGRQYELDRSDQGMMRALFDNVDRRFEPEYSGGAYWPNLLPVRRMQLQIGEQWLANPSFETNLTSWTSGGATFTRDTASLIIGRACAKIVSTGVGGNYIFSAGTLLAPLAGAKITATAYVKGSGSAIGKTAYVQVNETGGAFGEQNTQGTPVTLDGTVQRVVVTHTMIRNDRTGSYVTVGGLTFNTGDVLFIDGVQHVAGADQQPYVDLTRSVWTGFIESILPTYAGDWSEVIITCVDGSEILQTADLVGGPNLVANASFENGTTDDWTAINGTLAADAGSNTPAGLWRGKLTAHASVAPTDARPTSLPLELGKSYAAHAPIYIPSGLGITPSNVKVGLGYTGGSEVLGVAQALFDQWQLVPLPGLFSGAEQIKTFGRNTPGALLTAMRGDTASNGDPIGSNKQASPTTITDYALVTGMWMDITGNPGAGPGMLLKGILYYDSSGSPGLKIAETVERSIPRDTSLRRFEWFPFQTPFLIPPGTYWRGYIGGETSQSLRMGYEAIASSRAYNTDVYADGASPSFGTATVDAVDLAIYVTYSVSLSNVSYGFVRLDETGASKYILFDEFLVREVPASDGDLYDPAGADLSVAMSGLRVQRVLNAIDVPVADRLIDTGTSELAAVTFASSAQTKSLTHLQDVAEAELGMIFHDGEGRTVFHGRARRFNPTSLASYTDALPFSPGVFPHEELLPEYGKTRIANDVRVTPAVGATQIATDSASRTKYRPRTMQKNLQLSGEPQASDIADGILARVKEPSKRYARLTLDPVTLEAAQPGYLNDVLSREISDCIQVRENPPAHPGSSTQITKNVHIERISGKAEPPVQLTFEWQLSPVDSATYWVVEDPVYGAPDENGAAW